MKFKLIRSGRAKATNDPYAEIRPGRVKWKSVTARRRHWLTYGTMVWTSYPNWISHIGLNLGFTQNCQGAVKDVAQCPYTNNHRCCVSGVHEPAGQGNQQTSYTGWDLCASGARQMYMRPHLPKHFFCNCSSVLYAFSQAYCCSWISLGLKGCWASGLRIDGTTDMMLIEQKMIEVWRIVVCSFRLLMWVW